MAGPPKAVAAARSALNALDLPAGSVVVAGVSGGADSLALAIALAFVAPRRGWVARAVIVDHGLRDSSADDAERARSLCERLGLDAGVVRVSVDSSGALGPEGQAREARYAALVTAAGEQGYVLLGHTLDDQAENVLLGLARGSGTRSLSGMAPLRGRFLRPFLGLTRAETEAVCEAAGLTPIHDPSNDLDGPWRRADGGPLLRSAVRHVVLPVLEAELGPGVAQALARTAALARDDADALDALAARELARVTVSPCPVVSAPPRRHEDASGERRDEEGGDVLFGERPGGAETRLDAAELTRLMKAVRMRVLSRAIIGVGGADLTATHLWSVDRLVTRYRGQGAADLPGFITATREGPHLVIRRSGNGRNGHGRQTREGLAHSRGDRRAPDSAGGDH